jgi:UDP-N-acetyl-D-galactosamine dehydrogenase
VVKCLREYNTNVYVHDPWANPADVMHEYGITCQKEMIKDMKFDAIILTVAHDEFTVLDINGCLKEKSVVYDVKGILPSTIVDAYL